MNIVISISEKVLFQPNFIGFKLEILYLNLNLIDSIFVLFDLHIKNRAIYILYFVEGKTIILMRGVPGCGKTFIVGRLKDSLNTSAVCSADDYFVRSGTYRFDRSKIKEAHEWCHQKGGYTSILIPSHDYWQCIAVIENELIFN